MMICHCNIKRTHLQRLACPAATKLRKMLIEPTIISSKQRWLAEHRHWNEIRHCCLQKYVACEPNPTLQDRWTSPPPYCT
uniref:Uncharacterized protein n=1 Tax=Arundo donax TaxID=35708 RepID=A0A0A9AJ98_ARUDO